MRRGAIFAFISAGYILLLQSDHLSLKTAALIGYLAVADGIALSTKRLRGLLIADWVISALISALVITSPQTFADCRWGWLAHAGVVVLLLLTEAESVLLPLKTVYWLLIGLSVIGLLSGLLLLPPHYSLLALLLILWTLGGLLLIGAALIGRQMASSTTALSRVLLIALIAAGCIVSARSIRAFPNFSATDEAIIYDYMDTFERSGKIEASLVPYDAPTVTGNLYLYAAAIWTNLLPNDPFALRDFSMLGGLLLVAVVFAAARALDDRLTGWIAAALLATNLLWIATAHVGRQEIWLAVFVWSAVWLALEARKRRSGKLALLAGVIVALGADVHPLGAYACLALGLWWIVQKPNRLGNRRLLIRFIVGGLIGTAYYVGVHVLPDPAAFFAGLHDEAVSYGAEGWNPLAAMIVRHLSYLESNPLELGLLVVCSLWALRQRQARRLGIFVGALMLFYGTTVADPNLYYPIVWITGIVILTASAVRHAGWSWQAPLLAAFLAAFVLNAALIERHVSDDWNRRALDAIQQVAMRVPKTGRGMGELFVYLALRDSDATQASDYIGFTFVNFWAADAGISRWQVVETLKPDWIVTMTDERAFTPEFGVLSVDVPHMRLEIPQAALAQDYHLVGTVATSVGTFEIWQQ